MLDMLFSEILVFFGNFWSSSKARNAVLLLGLCDSGKTLLFTQVSNAVFIKIIQHKLSYSFTTQSFDWKWLAVFFQLLLGKFVKTQTSITENSTTYKSKNDRVSYLISLQLCAFEVMRHLSGFQTFDLISKVTHWRFNGRLFLISQGGSWTLIDVPGHESLRVQIVEKYKAVARWVMKINMSWLNSDCAWRPVHSHWEY